MIYQIHKDHGYHIALTRDEADGNEKRGWRTVTEKEFYDRPKKPVKETVKIPGKAGADSK